MHRGRQLEGDLNGLVIRQICSPESFHCSPSIRFEYKIAIDHHPHRKSWPDRQCRLDVHLLPHELLPRLAHRVAKALPQRLNVRRIVGSAIGSRIHLAANGE